jgi:hypothetical protein
MHLKKIEARAHSKRPVSFGFEQCFSNVREFLFEAELKAIFESITANNASLMGEEDNTTTGSLFLSIEVFVLNYGQDSLIFANSFSLSFHNFCVQVLALLKHRGSHSHILFAH